MEVLEEQNLCNLLEQLILLPQETEWLEFKKDNDKPEEIGEYISALSNSATLQRQNTAYIVWGVENNTHKIVGTQFKPKQSKTGNEELENWLARNLLPRINFKIYEFTCQNESIVLFEISSATYQPVSFKGTEYIRVATYKKKLKDYPEKERELWSLFSCQVFEEIIAIDNLTSDEVITKVNYPSYFELSEQHLPTDKQGILDRLSAEKFIKKKGQYFAITNLGAIL